HRLLREGNYAARIGGTAPVFLAAVLEYLAAEVLDLAGYAAQENKKIRINPRHVLLAVQSDDELSTLLSNVTISDGGVMPNVHPSLVQKVTITTVPADQPSTSKQG
ncbi:H2A2 protein, partial [Podargus strigoides]|nr:H2A2 protein [Podargus strigoides]